MGISDENSQVDPSDMRYDDEASVNEVCKMFRLKDVSLDFIDEPNDVKSYAVFIRQVMPELEEVNPRVKPDFCTIVLINKK